MPTKKELELQLTDLEKVLSKKNQKITKLNNLNEILIKSMNSQIEEYKTYAQTAITIGEEYKAKNLQASKTKAENNRMASKYLYYFYKTHRNSGNNKINSRNHALECVRKLGKELPSTNKLKELLKPFSSKSFYDRSVLRRLEKLGLGEFKK